MNFPKLIHELMAAGMTQAEIAERCQCTQSTISRIASGRTTPTYILGDALVRLSQRTPA